MKNLLLTLTVFAVVGLTSCKKDRVCTCTNTDTAPGSTTTTTETTILKEKKGVAKAACVKKTEEYTSGSNTYVMTQDCKLK